jgi:hypothetical protein
MRRIFDFRCSNDHVFEAFVDSECRETDCRECSETATRMISPVRTMLDPISGSFPGATMKWARDREKKIQKERRSAE